MTTTAMRQLAFAYDHPLPPMVDDLPDAAMAHIHYRERSRVAKQHRTSYFRITKHADGGWKAWLVIAGKSTELMFEHDEWAEVLTRITRYLDAVNEFEREIQSHGSAS